MKASEVSKHVSTLDPEEDVIVIPRRYYDYVMRHSKNLGANAEMILMRLACGEDIFPPRYIPDLSAIERCLGLTKAFPELRPRMSEIGKVSYIWSIFAEHWEELEETFRKPQKVFGGPSPLSIAYQEVLDIACAGCQIAHPQCVGQCAGVRPSL